MHSALLIARREYLERVRSKAFRISTVVIPIVFAGIFGIGAFSAMHLGGDTDITVASNDTQLAQGVRDELLHSDHPPTHVDVVAPATQSDIDTLIQNEQYATEHRGRYAYLSVEKSDRTGGHSGRGQARR